MRIVADNSDQDVPQWMLDDVARKANELRGTYGRYDYAGPVRVWVDIDGPRDVQRVWFTVWYA